MNNNTPNPYTPPWGNRNPWIPFWVYTSRKYYLRFSAYIATSVLPVVKQKIFAPLKEFFSPLAHFIEQVQFDYVFPFLERYVHVIIVSFMISIVAVICYFLVKVLIFLKDDLILMFKAINDTINDYEKWIKGFFKPKKKK